MRSKIFIGMALAISIPAIATLAASDVVMPQSEQRVVMNFDRPTMIVDAIVMGPVLIVHNEAKEQVGQPCTTIYRFDPAKGRKEEIVSFSCKMVEKPVVDKFTASCKLSAAIGLHVLTEYQFPGDTRAHDVPSRW